MERDLEGIAASLMLALELGASGATIHRFNNLRHALGFSLREHQDQPTPITEAALILAIERAAGALRDQARRWRSR